jgi:hypothetical protein
VTFLDNLQSHKGGLIHLKTQLYWYKGRGWDNNPGRICLLLDATTAAESQPPSATCDLRDGADHADALLLIDRKLQWVWVAERDIDLLVNDPPTN